MTCLDNATKEQLASLCKEKEIPVLWEEPMKHYTSFQIGGPASAVCIPKNREQLSCLLSFLRKMQINHWFVGNGSNLLISDEGLKGVVILLDSDFDGEILISNTVLEAPAGKKLSSVCAAACPDYGCSRLHPFHGTVVRHLLYGKDSCIHPNTCAVLRHGCIP